MSDTIAAITRTILAAPAPVLLPDTASLLNALEACMPEERANANIVPAIVRLLAQTRNQPQAIWVVVAEAVKDEWLRHHVTKLIKAVAAVRRVDDGYASLWRIAASLACAPLGPATQFSGLQIPQRMHDVAEQLLQSALVIANNDEFNAAAGLRIAKDYAPASPGKPEFNDCVITEQYLALCRSLRSQNFSERCIFVTSNTKDYGEPNAPKPPLDSEFAAVRIDFVYDFAAAVAAIV